MNKEHYKSRKGTSFILLVIMIGILLAYVVWRSFEVFSVVLVSIIPLLVLTFLYLLWISHYTSYKIYDGRLFYQSGFMRGHLLIDAITKIEQNKTQWTGAKPALASRGLVIHYSTYDTLYVSPQSPESFCKSLVSRNKKIILV